ncbi:MAG TPA: PD-(D/E)XK nuclease family protein [Kofleriaceae bacterium]|nr:PD-(D/E)XK nuclease family protein [Kofleriaceae bacterium]
MASTRATRLAPWSASKIQMALRCPREFHYRYIERVPEVETMADARIGKAVHSALEHALQGTLPQLAIRDARAELPDEDEQRRYDLIAAGVEPFLDRVASFRRRYRVNRQLVEFSLAVRADFTATQFYSGDAFYRGLFDVGFLYDDNLAIIDHKTGFRIASHRITEQLQGYAVLSAATFRGARRFRLGVHWVADNDVEWAPAIDHAEINQRLLPQVADNIEAAALAVNDGPRPDPGMWCGRCSYRSICPAAYALRYEPVDDYDDTDDDYE